MLLYQIGEISLGQAVKNSTLDLLREGTRTPDLGGEETTRSFTEAVADEVARRVAANAPAPSDASAAVGETTRGL